ncbi:MAG: DUF1819 family protein [Lewinellaceae bacterium]|nr:DUF1819 family protein [Lewinellaceae bacterium]
MIMQRKDTPETLYIQPPLPYNADINPIASIPDLQVIYNAFAGKLDVAEFGQRTERTSIRLNRVIRVNLLQYYSADHKELMEGVFSNEKALRSWNLFLFWQLALTNRLVFEILSDLFFKYYFEGRATLPKQEIIAYLKDKRIQSSETGEVWSDTTIERIASKLLTFLKRLEVMEGVKVKNFKSVLLGQRELTIFCYLLMAVYPEASNFLEVPLRKFSFSSKEAFIQQVKKLAVKDFLDVQYDGNKLKISPKHHFNKIVDVLYH